MNQPDRPSVPLSRRAVEHLARECRLRLDALERTGRDEREAAEAAIDRLAERIRDQYRTLRPAAAAALFEHYRDQGDAAGMRLALALLARLARRAGPDIFERVRSWRVDAAGEEVAAALATWLAEHAPPAECPASGKDPRA